ncbi:hypothetical protein Sru01_16010 [Sphaerisporangium rufum]|uniref:Intracellular septation protein A n=1 Tax=Sphaerisporangium rufum TaxID=1381558 RepID=A0A919UY93_9ACTN|nr:VC0807 family protein [Sphaerisporangium rufum]GII76619.1 hypothetical protein Sru01_16010 [Sphaerisporangium rufum]
MTRRRRHRLLLLVDLAGPIALYYLLRLAGQDVHAAALISSLVPGLDLVTALVRRRRPEAVAVFMTVMMLGSALVSLLNGDPRFVLAKEGWLTGVTGLWMLASAWSRQPLTVPFTRLLLEGRIGPGRPRWEVMWELPRFRRIWRVCTVLWGIGLLADAAVRVVMAYTLPLDTVPGLTAAQYVVFVLLMQVVMNVYLVPSGVYNQWSRLYEPLRARQRAGG